MTNKQMFRLLRDVIDRQRENLERYCRENTHGRWTRLLALNPAPEEVRPLRALIQEMTASFQNSLHDAGIRYRLIDELHLNLKFDVNQALRPTYAELMDSFLSLCSGEEAKTFFLWVDGSLLKIQKAIERFLDPDFGNNNGDVFSNPFQAHLNRLYNRLWENKDAIADLDVLQKIVSKGRPHQTVVREDGTPICPVCDIVLEDEFIRYCPSCGQRVLIPHTHNTTQES